MILASPCDWGFYRAFLAVADAAEYDFMSPAGRKFIAATIIVTLSLLGIFGGIPAVARALTGAGAAAMIGVAVLIFPLGVYGAIRVFLLFPLIAIDQPLPLSRSLSLTPGRAWRLLCILALPMIAAALLEYPASASGPVAQLPVAVFISGLKAFADLASTCGIALAYLWISGSEDRPVLTRAPSPDAARARS